MAGRLEVRGGRRGGGPTVAATENEHPRSPTSVGGLGIRIPLASRGQGPPVLVADEPEVGVTLVAAGLREADDLIGHIRLLRVTGCTPCAQLR